MPLISLTRGLKLTNEDALKILNSKPSKKMQEILKSIESKNDTKSMKNKLVLKHLWKKNLNQKVEIIF